MEKRAHKHLKNHKRLPDSVQKISSSYKAFGDKSSKVPNQGISRNDCRNKETSGVQSYRTNQVSDGFSLYSVFEKENKWRKSSYIQSQETERLRLHSDFSPNKPTANTFPHKEGRSHDENRHLAGVFSRPNNVEPSTVSLLRVSRNYLRDDLSSLWFGECAVSVRKNNELDRTTTETEKLTRNRLSGRFSDYPRRSYNAGNSSEICGEFYDTDGMADKSSKNIHSCCNQVGISWDLLGYKRKHQRSIRSQSSSTEELHNRSPRENAVELARCESNSRQVELRIASSATRTTPLSYASTSCKTLTAQTSPSKIPHNGTCKGRTRLVVKERSQKHPHSLCQSIDFHHHRCSGRRLGSHSEQPYVLEQMDADSKKLAQQHERTVGCIRGSPMPWSRSIRENSYVTIRQPHDCGVYQQTGRDEINDIVESVDEDSSALREHAVPSSCPSYSRSIQWAGRQPITRKNPLGMASQQNDSIDVIQKVRQAANRSVCVKEICRGTKLCERRCFRSSESIHRCIQQNMAIPAGMDFSSSGVDSACTESFRDLRGTVHHHRPSVGQGVLETRSPTTGRRASILDPGPSQELNRSTHESSPSGCRAPKVGGLDGSGWSKQVKNWSDLEIKLLEASWRASTLKTYKPIWTRWRHWALSKNIPVDNPEPEDLAKYLCYLYREIKLAPRTIALHKSVVANFSNPLRAEELSSHPTVRRIVKGTFAESPPTIKVLSWKIEDLLSYLKTYTITENSLFAISRHTCILLLLATGRRVHDLTLLSIENGAYEDKGNEVIFWPKFGSKTDTNSYRQSGWLLKKPSNISNKQLDLVYWIKKLIFVSTDRRNPRGLQNLFITTRGVTKNASRTVIAGWIRTLFKEAGISASAGSFRSAVSSHNWVNSQHNIDEILRRGNWRSKNTFFKHYFRELKYVPRSNSNELSTIFSPIR